MSPPQRQQEAYLKLAKPQQKNDPLHRSKILLLGTRRSGKSSILQVLFKNLPSKQTFYLEPTMRVTKHPYDTLIPLEIWDCPGNITVDTLGAPLSEFASIVFVIDIRDLYQQPVVKLVEFIVAACQVNPNINLEVFVHKAEKLQEDDKIENFRQIHERVMDRLVDESPEYEQVPLNFHLTSVYDYTLQEAFSRVIHKLIDSLPYLENLLNVFCSNTSSPKAFLFDTTSKLYVATDASPVDQATHNLCCDYLQMLNSFGPLYKSNAPPQADTPDSAKPSTKAPFYPSASTSLSPSQPVTLTYHLVTPHLALVASLPTPVFEMRRGLVEWNVVWFREGVREIWEVEKERSEGELV
ncbi:Gtr1 raga G protein Gtr2 [Boletus reticuloceps]|uniref:GTP-binding protein n=1 Tax=Boletus reticuloceps TaxID=495285 RepID=A0A8I2YKL0_9AGAM|nr:Gtr1 raga G protein Gtr2 [Boletus reticuloceps]